MKQMVAANVVDDVKYADAKINNFVGLLVPQVWRSKAKPCFIKSL